MREAKLCFVLVCSDTKLDVAISKLWFPELFHDIMYFFYKMNNEIALFDPGSSRLLWTVLVDKSGQHSLTLC